MPEYKVEEDEQGLRLDRWLGRRFSGYSYATIQKWIRTGQVRVNGRRHSAGVRLYPEQVVRLPPCLFRAKNASNSLSSLHPEKVEAIKSMVIHMDAHVIALAKPAGLAVQGGASVHSSLAAMLSALSFGAPSPPYLVHRLDRATSGVLLLARSRASAAALAAAFRLQKVNKLYWAVLAGIPQPLKGRCSHSIIRLPGKGYRGVRARAARQGESGMSAQTDYKTLACDGNRSWVAFKPKSGRLHQIRIHACVLGTPILGDPIYGHETMLPNLSGLHLHGRALEVDHPTGGRLKIVAPVPEPMLTTLRMMNISSACLENESVSL